MCNEWRVGVAEIRIKPEDKPKVQEKPRPYTPDFSWIYDALQRHPSKTTRECGHRLGERWVSIDEAAARLQRNPHEANVELIITQLAWFQKDLAELVAALIIPEASDTINKAVKGALTVGQSKDQFGIKFLEDKKGTP